jgi:hypothetical protein
MEHEMEREERGSFVTKEGYRPEPEQFKFSNLVEFVTRKIPPSLLK